MKKHFGLLLLTAATLVGCNPAKTAAEADYTAQQLACVDESATKDESTACRNRVKAAWAADAGGDR